MTIPPFPQINDWLHHVWLKPANSDLAADVDWVFMYILWVSIVSFVLLMGVMFYCIFKYRRRPGVPAQRTPNHNTLLEITLVLVPLILVTLMFFWGFQGYMHTQVAPAGAETIYVTGSQWDWSILYANGAISNEQKDLEVKTDGGKTISEAPKKAPVFIVPENTPVMFKLISKDVIHSLYLPDQRVKIDVMPNRYTSLTFTPGKALTDPDKAVDPVTHKQRYVEHPIFCAEYCGQDHSEMYAILRIVPREVYDETLADWGNVEKKYGEGLLPLWQLGEWVFNNQGCKTCHTVDPKADGTAPSWAKYYGTAISFESGPDLDPNKWEDYVEESIKIPSAKIHKGFTTVSMPSFAGQVTEKQIKGVIEYMKHLRGLDAPVPGAKPAAPAAHGNPPTPSTPPAPAAPPADKK